MECSTISSDINTLRNTNRCALCIRFYITLNNNDFRCKCISFTSFVYCNRCNFTISRNNIELGIRTITINNKDFWVYIIRTFLSNLYTSDSFCCNIKFNCSFCSITCSWVYTNNNRNFLIVKS